MRQAHRFAVGLLTCAAGAVCARTDVLAADYTHNRLMRFSQTDGSLIDPDYLQFGSEMGEPFDVVQVDNEIWVSDVLMQQVVRYSLDGSTQLGVISGFTGAAFGMEYVPHESAVFLAVGRGGQPDDIHRIDTTTHSITGTFQTTGAFDVTDAGGSLLVSDEERDVVDRYDYDGTFLGQFADVEGGAGKRYPSQLAWQDSDTLALGCGGWGQLGKGIVLYGTDGSVQDSWSLSDGAIGLAVLDNGTYLVSLNGAGYIAVYDPVADTLTRVGPEDSRAFYMSRVVIPAPATPSAALLSVCLAVRRRR